MSRKQPHILLITTDQQRYDATSETGPSFLRTPHFRHLCNQGVLFRRAYADCPLCVPSRTTIMTGQPAYEHGLAENGMTRGVIDRNCSLPSVLGQLGYQTAAIGKMHWGPQRMRHGFHEMILPDDYYREMGARGEQLQPMRHGLGQNEIHPGMATVPEAQTLTAWTAERCVDYIRYRRDPEAPFFIWCSFSKPHPPFDPPEPYYSMYRNCDIPEPVIGDWAKGDDCPISFRRFMERQGSDCIPPEIIREARSAYYGLITQIDYNMGRVFAALQEEGIFGDTLIIYASDHGEYLGDHLTCSKVFFHESSARIPFVLRLPPAWESSHIMETDDRLVTLTDIFPTLVGAAGGIPPDEVSGRNLLELLDNPEKKGREYVVSLQGAADDLWHISATDGKWKYCYYPEGKCEQVFNLEDDPTECRNLVDDAGAAEHRTRLRNAIVEELKERGTKYLNNGQLPEIEPKNDTLAFRRSHAFPGFSTEYKDIDTRH